MASNHPIWKYISPAPRPVRMPKRWDGTNQAHRKTFADATSDMFTALHRIAERMARFEPEYTRRERLVFKVQELWIVARESVRDPDPLVVAVIAGAALVGIAVGMLFTSR
jgi:hypothetical protein